MANIMMPPIFAQAVSAGVDSKAQLPVGEDASFAQHLERQVRSTRREKDSLAGVDQARVSKTAESKAKKDVAVKEPKAAPGREPQERQGRDTNEVDTEERQTPVSVEAILQQLMVELKDMAKQGNTETAGEWTFQLTDVGLLEKLADQAGMDNATLALLKEQMQQQGGLPLADLFAALAKSFQGMSEQTKVTVQETALPLLETILTKLGVSPEAIQKLDAQAVDGVDQLDLERFLQGLRAIAAQAEQGAVEAAPAGCVLSDWEMEQLTAMLEEAGVPAETIASLFPEKLTMEQKALAGLRPEQGDQPVVMSLERMKDLLAQAINAVNEAQPKPDVPGFLDSLEIVVSQSGFQSKDVGWSPVIQGAMSAAYDKLQKMVEQSREGKAMAMMESTEALHQEWQLSGQEEQSLAEAAPLGDGLGQKAGESLPGADDLATLAGKKVAPQGGSASADTLATLGGMEVKASPQGHSEAAVRVHVPRVPFSAQLQQLTVEQISQGVLRGLRNNEHQLTLTLYPKELGEVKVELQMRGSQLSANFVMENQKVKEALESNMGEFKDNLERRGFTLGDMSVSVGQQHDQGDANQRFVAAWEQMVASHGQDNAALVQAGPAEFAATQTLRSSQGSGINLFV